MDFRYLPIFKSGFATYHFLIEPFRFKFKAGPMLLGLAMSFRVYVPVAHLLLMGFLLC